MLEPLPGDSSSTTAAPIAPPNYDEIINRYSQKYGVNPKIIHSLANVEHGTDSSTGKFRTSPKGAIGPMQLMPETAKAYKVDPTTPEGNIEGGIRYYSDLLKRHGNDHEALRHYHGIGNDGFTTDQQYADAILNRANKQDVSVKSGTSVSTNSTAGTKYIRIQGVGRFQVPADYSEDQIRQHIQQLKQSKPEIFAKNPVQKPGETLDAQLLNEMHPDANKERIGPPPKDDRGWGSRLLTAAGGIMLGPLGAPAVMSAFSDKNDLENVDNKVRNFIGPNKPGLDTLGGAVLGPIKAARGAAEIPSHPVRGVNKYLAGTMDTAALPMAVANPGFLAESMPYVGASELGRTAISAFTNDPDYQELGGNVAALGLKPGLKGVQKGAELLDKSPNVQRALTWGTTLAPLYDAIHGNFKRAGETLAGGLAAKAGIKLGSKLPDLPTPLPKETPITRSTMKNSQLRSYMGMGQEPKLGTEPAADLGGPETTQPGSSAKPSSSELGSEEKINLGKGEIVHPEDDPTIADEEDYFKNFKSNIPEGGLTIEGDPAQVKDSPLQLGPGQQEPTLGKPEPEWPASYRNTPKQTSSTGGGGANYSETDLDAFKTKNKDFLNKGMTEEPTTTTQKLDDLETLPEGMGSHGWITPKGDFITAKGDFIDNKMSDHDAIAEKTGLGKTGSEALKNGNIRISNLSGGKTGKPELVIQIGDNPTPETIERVRDVLVRVKGDRKVSIDIGEGKPFGPLSTKSPNYKEFDSVSDADSWIKNYSSASKPLEKTMQKDDIVSKLDSTTEQLFPGKKVEDLTEEEYNQVADKALGKPTEQATTTVTNKPTEQQLSTLSDTQLRHAAHQADIPVEPGETAKTLIPKLIKAMNGEPIEAKPKPEEPDIADQLQKSLDAIKNKKNAGQK